MDTATTAELESHEEVRDSRPTPKPIDPTRDIDAKATVFWLIVSTVAVFLSLWLLYVLFGAVIQGERAKKIEDAPATQLEGLREYEQRMLDAGPAEGEAVPARPKSIDQAIQELSGR